MAKDVVQFRYYGDGDSDNWPLKCKSNIFKNGSAFKDYYPILYLKIHGPNDTTKFYINGNSNSIMLHKDNNFELDLEGYGEICQLSFDKSLSATKKNPLIIDIVYEKGNN